MFVQGGLIVKKKEMTSVPVNEKLTAVTIVEVVPQKVIRHKTQEKDGYTALVVGIVGKNDTYLKQKEFNISPELLESFPVGYVFDETLFDDGSMIAVQGVSKGKGYAGPIKRYGMAGMPHTHGHKFRRSGGSKGNRKPRRGFKGHPHAGHMGTDTVTLKNIPVLQKMSFENKKIIVLKGSLPGAFNSYLSLYK
ncbi:50S ribosomal protein L3 [candidate division SR1 bacterium Aalborg_AAW-1]|nr:50S ribosomal protein L3 [candidate division SR1 bacterium Aalborg_AAW-1]